MISFHNLRYTTSLAVLFRALKRSLCSMISARFLWLSTQCLLAALLLAAVLWLLANNLFLYWIGPWLQSHLPTYLTSPTSHWAGLFLFILFSSIFMAWLIVPLMVLLAGQLTDNVAEIIEQEAYPNQKPGNALSNGQSLKVSLHFLGLSLLYNVLALPFLWVPVLNVVVFFLINAYLLGREYFEFAAARFRRLPQAHLYYRKQRKIVFVGGLFVAAVVAIPILNIFAPLFAAALMVHLHKLLSARDNVLKQTLHAL